MNIDTTLLEGSLNPFNFYKLFKYKLDFAQNHPNYFLPEGLLVFCGSQGAGKTLSAVKYVSKCLKKYPDAILCSNVEITEFPINCYYKRNTEIQYGIEKTFVKYYLIDDNSLVRSVCSYFEDGVQKTEIINYATYDLIFGHIVIEYNGLDTLKDIENGEEGVIYLIDEIHLEFNSLESKNIPIEVMIEVSQQRKQRKHIVGTSQVYMRMAKPFREQIKNVVICRNFFKCIQWNKLIDGETSHEENGELKFDTQKFILWLHSPADYKLYDTYKKMRRYRNEWNGVSRSDIYQNTDSIIKNL